jgi:hypothetical protein
MIGDRVAADCRRNFGSGSVHNDRVQSDRLGERLCRLCVLPSGRLAGLRFHDHAARAATLIDLVLWRRINRASTGELVISTTPTGNTVADRMLAHIDRHPDSTTDDILAKAPGRMAHFVDDAGPERSWYSRTPRIPDHEVAAERRRLERAATGDIDSPRTAALAMLADALQLIALSQPENVLRECGEAAWIVEDCVDYLLLVRYRYELGTAAGSVGGGG